MKKIVFSSFILVLLFIISCNDSDETINYSSNDFLNEKYEISKTDAEKVALNFMKKVKNSNPNSEQSVNNILNIVETTEVKDKNGKLGIYAVNLKSGFALVASNTKEIPILAYSEDDQIELDDNSPDPLKCWVAESISMNDELEKMNEPTEQIETQWDNLLARPAAPSNDPGIYLQTVTNTKGPLLSTFWHQRYPYNQFTPNNYLTGCVAVATAQIMRYNKWPTTFNWAIMPNNPFSINAGSTAIANLMSDIGNKVGMEYSADSSSANSEDVRDVLVNNYGYSSTAFYSDYNYNTIVQDINASHPVYMSGKHTMTIQDYILFQIITYSDGHAWVCDGYKVIYDVYGHWWETPNQYTTNENYQYYLHMNWGWGNFKNCNGWYMPNYLTVWGATIGVDGNSIHPNFQYNKKCIYRIKQ